MAAPNDAFLNLSDEDLDKLIGIDANGVIDPVFMQAALVDAMNTYPRLYSILSGGAVASEAELLQVVENRISDGMYKMERYFAAIQDESNPYTLADWQNAMMSELRNMHIQAYLAGLNVS